MRTLARLGIGIAIVLVVVVLGAIVLIKTIDPNTLIAPVQAQVKAATGRDLAVRGGARVALSLHPRVVLSDVVLSNAPWGTAKELARIERLELAVALMPLLSRRFELTEIALVKPVFALETDGKGQKNWQAASAAPSAAPSAAGSGPGLAAAAAIGNVTVTDGTFTYQDGPKAVPSRVIVETLALRPRALRSGLDVAFKGAVGDVPLVVEGTVGSLEMLVARATPYPVDLKGQVAGQAFAIATRVKAESSRYAFDDLKLALGANAIEGTLSVDAGGARPKVVFDLRAGTLGMRALPMPAIPASPAPPPKSTRAYMIPDTPVSFVPLRWFDADGKLAIGNLTLADGQAVRNVELAFTIVDARLKVPRFALGVFGGTLSGSVSVDATRSDAAALNVRLDGSGLSLGEILAAAGHPREVRGGSTQVAVDLAMRGNSPHEWASTATGNVSVVSGRATLLNSKIDPAAVFDRLGAAINPFRTRDPSTELVCAVARFPVANGIARVDRSIAMETDKLGVSASGTLDFRNETLDFQFNPKIRKGISIDLASLSDLVRVTGPFASPHVAIDPAGSAKVIASVGAAISTGGLSAVAQGLLAWADGSGPGPCRIALDGAAAQSSAAAAPAPQVPIASEVGRALGKLFGR